MKVVAFGGEKCDNKNVKVAEAYETLVPVSFVRPV